MDPLKILIFGDVNGNLDGLVKKCNKISKTAGKFDMLLCVGEFFDKKSSIHSRKEALQKYIAGSAKIPIPTFIIDQASNGFSELNTHKTGGSGVFEIACNLTYLGESGVYSPESGLSLAFLCKSRPSAFDTTSLVNSTTFSNLIGCAEFKGIDILLSGGGIVPARVHETAGGKAAATGWCDQREENEELSRLALQLRPRYHFSASTPTHQRYFERTPYRNHRVLLERARHVTRFIKLAPFANQSGDEKSEKSEKSVYALRLHPIGRMGETELTKQPDLATDCPYWSSSQQTQQIMGQSEQQQQQQQQHGRTVEDPYEKSLQSGQMFFDMSSVARKRKFDNNSRGGRGGSGGGFAVRSAGSGARGGGAGKIARGPDDNCWFCLGNPTVEKHLLVRIDTLAYVAMPKGPLHPLHALVCSVEHAPHWLALSPACRAEIGRIKAQFARFFASANQERDGDNRADSAENETEERRRAGMAMIAYERNFKSPHFQLNLIPVSRELLRNDRLIEVMRARAVQSNSGPCGAEQDGGDTGDGEEMTSQFAEIPAHSDLSEIAASRGGNRDPPPYLYVEIWTPRVTQHDDQAQPVTSHAVRKFFTRISRDRWRSFDLQFVRSVLCDAELMNAPRLVNWRECAQSREREEEMVRRMRAELEREERRDGQGEQQEEERAEEEEDDICFVQEQEEEQVEKQDDTQTERKEDLPID